MQAIPIYRTIGHHYHGTKVVCGSVKVDDEDHERIGQFVWCEDRHPSRNATYACRYVRIANGSQTLIHMHRDILGLSQGDGVLVDHADGDGLNNQKSNLRKATPAQNNHNHKLRSDSRSGYKGVSWSKRSGVWHASIHQDGAHVFLGSYANRDEAGVAYNVAALAMRGEFARGNDIENSVSPIRIMEIESAVIAKLKSKRLMPQA